MVGAAFVGLLLSVGVLVVYSFGVLSSTMAREFGWSDVQRATLFFAFSLCSTVAGPVWGALADRLGARTVSILSLVLLAACFGVLATAPIDLLLAQAIFAAMGLLGSGTLPPIYASVVVGWFDRRRGLALGLTMVGVGLGAAILPAIAARIVAQYGWREMCLAYGLMILLLPLPIAAVFLRAYPQEHGLRRDPATPAVGAALAAAVLQPRTWILAVFAFVTGGILVASVTNFVPMLQSRGETLVRAAQYQSIIGLSLVAGRLIGGGMLDRIFAPRVITAVLLFTSAGYFALHQASSPAAYLVAAIGIGMTVGTEIDFLGFLVSRYFDRAAFTTIFALFFAIYSLGATAGGPLFAWLVQVSGGYDLGLAIFAGVTFLLGLLMFTLPRYAARE